MAAVGERGPFAENQPGPMGQRGRRGDRNPFAEGDHQAAPSVVGRQKCPRSPLDLQAQLHGCGMIAATPVGDPARKLFGRLGPYTGCDMQAGDGVDVVADLTADFDSLPGSLTRLRYRTILCMSVMEHVRDVYRFAANLRRLLAEDGVALISVPWVWRFHGYPSDYWRFSPEALKFLFEPLVLEHDGSCLSYQQPGRFGPLSTAVLNTYPDYEADTAPPSPVGRAVLKLYRGMARIAPRLAHTRRQVLYPTMINAVFRKA